MGNISTPHMHPLNNVDSVPLLATIMLLSLQFLLIVFWIAVLVVMSMWQPMGSSSTMSQLGTDPNLSCYSYMDSLRYEILHSCCILEIMARFQGNTVERSQYFSLHTLSSSAPWRILQNCYSTCILCAFSSPTHAVLVFVALPASRV